MRGRGTPTDNPIYEVSTIDDDDDLDFAELNEEPSPTTSAEQTADHVADTTMQDGDEVSRSDHGYRPGAVEAAILVIAGLGAYFLHKWISNQRRHKGRNSVDYSSLVEACPLPAATDTLGPAAPFRPLAGLKLIFSDLFDVEGHVSQYPSADASPRRAPRTAEALQLAAAAGAQPVGRATNDELQCGLLGGPRTIAIPGTPDSRVGGTGSAAVAAVAAGLADVALGVDHLNGIRVHAAACGLYGFRATAGLAPSAGTVSVAGPIDALAWAARTPTALRQVAAALKLPGGGLAAKADLVYVLVAEDVFLAAGGPAAGMAQRACKAAAEQWAPDMLARVALLRVLQAYAPLARDFLDEGERGPDNPNAASGTDITANEGWDVLAGLARAAGALQSAELLAGHGHLLFHEGAARPQALAQMHAAAAGAEEGRVEAAREVMGQARAALREICRDGNVLLVPGLPGPVPSAACAPPDNPLRELGEEADEYEQRTMGLAAIAALAGVPQVCIPLAAPGGGVTSVALLGLHKSDQRLLGVAEGLGPLIGAAAEQLAAASAPQPSRQNGRTQWAQTNGAGPTAKPKGKRGGGQGKNSQPSREARARGEELKTAGNDELRAGNVEGALAAYSRAIAADPTCATYYSNRAFAYLKLMRFEEAEADCDEALKREVGVKALLRRATARTGLQDFPGARADYKHALSLEPNNRQAREELRALKATEDLMVDATDLEPAGVNGVSEDAFL